MIKVLQNRLNDLKASSSDAPVSAVDASTAIHWDKPASDPRLSDFAAVRKSYDREEAATKYKTAVDNVEDKDYTARDATSAKLQSDILASMQQAFIMRGRSRLHCIADAMSMRKAIGDSRIALVHERYIANLDGAE